MKKKILMLIKKDLKSGKNVVYPYLEPTLEDCYQLYDNEGYTFENKNKVIDYLYTSQLKSCVEIGKEL